MIPLPQSSIKHIVDLLESATRPDSETQEDFEDPLGLCLLHKPEDPLVDLVFVHGLWGGSRRTWTNSCDLDYWPKSWLPRDPGFQKVRITSYGYEVSGSASTRKIIDLEDLGVTLCEQLCAEKYIHSPRPNPIILVGHNLGGIIAKKAFLHSANFNELRGRIRAIIFLGTPHKFEDHQKLVRNIRNASPSTGAKSPDMETVEGIFNINSRFPKECDGLISHSFCETRPTWLSPGESVLIVEEDSAASSGIDREEKTSLRVNHYGLTQYEDPSGLDYLKLRNVLVRIIDSLLQGHAHKDDVKSQLDTLKSSLKSTVTPEDELYRLEEQKKEGTCDWIVQNDAFSTWRDTTDPRFIFWLSGMPATGKSVLAAHVVRYLESMNAPCSYYFFDNANPANNSLSSMLCSLALQMSRSNYYVREKLIELKNSGAMPTENSSSIWQTLFSQTILRADFPQRHYWVIDALDQCKEASVFLSFLQKLAKVQDIALRIFVTSQHTHELRDDFDKLSGSLQREKTARRNIDPDIRTLFEGEPLPVDRKREKFIRMLVDRSDGNFLWASAIIIDLRDTFTHEAIQKALISVPDKMDVLYKRALEAMVSKIKRENKTLAKTILTWIVCAVRLLTVEELREALSLDPTIGREILDLEKFIDVSFRHLLYVDGSKQVRVAHPTVRAFLLKEGLDSEFAIDNVQGHSRLAETCLLRLTTREMIQPPFRRRQNQSSAKREESRFLRYACVAFSAHLREADATNQRLIGLLEKFIKVHVLAWIEIVASDQDSQDLSQLISASGNLQRYRKQRIAEESRNEDTLETFIFEKPPFEKPPKKYPHLDSWTTDIIQLVARFGQNLQKYPFSIYYMIPPLCPKGSEIFQNFGDPARGIEISGIAATTWDDRISCISFMQDYATAVASRGDHFAVGLDGGSIVLFSQTSCQEVWRREHGEKVIILQFDTPRRHLISSGSRKVSCWNVENGEHLWSYPTAQQVMGLGLQIKYHSNDPEEILLVDRGNSLTRIPVKDGPPGPGKELPPPKELYHWTQEIEAGRQPLLAVFSDVLNLFAVAYRGQPIGLWDLESNDWLGYLDKRDDTSKGAVAGACDMVFHPQESMMLLAAGFLDSELVLFDVASQTKISTLHGVDAQKLAASPDGKSLIAYCSSGEISIFSFGSTLRKIHSISCEIPVVALAFGSDDNKFFDVRENQCNVWQPTILLRKDILESGSESSFDSAVPNRENITGFDEDPIITAVAFDTEGKHVFCGKANGSVAIFAASSGAEINPRFYSHARNTSVMDICVGATRIASVDMASKILVHKLELKKAGWQLKTPPVLELPVEHQVFQIMICDHECRLLVSTSKASDLYDISGSASQDGRIHHKDVPKAHVHHKDVPKAHWREHPMRPGRLVMHDGKDTKSYTANGLNDESIADDVIIPYQAPYLSTHHWHLGCSILELLALTSFLDLHFNDDAKDSFMWLSEQYELLIGIQKPKLRIVFLNWDKWVCSIDMDGFRKRRLERHFFIPYHWLSPGRTPLMRLNASGQLVLAKGEELVVISKGLDCGVKDTDDRRQLSP